MLICTYTYQYICSVCIRNYQNIHLNNIAFKFFTVQDRPRRDATTLLSVKRNHKISQTTTNYHSTTSFYYCFLSTTACTTMHNRASYQLLIPWLSLGRFSCLFFISSTLPQDWLKICTTEPQINFLFLGYPLVTSTV
jgi:hypothetical protein